MSDFKSHVLMPMSEPYRQVCEWLQSFKVSMLTSDFATVVEASKENIGFNAFSLVSDVYHRENFHSDILRAMLDPEGGHGMGGSFLELFFKFLRERHKINLPEYSNPCVSREKFRIDLLIRDEETRRAIIIENKINGAPDMYRQIPRYLQIVEGKQGYQCDAIIYLSLNHLATPSMHDWTTEERQRIDQILLPVCACSDSEESLTLGFLDPCAKLCDSHSVPQTGAEIAMTIRQYSRLIQKLEGDSVIKPIMKEFYELVKDEDELKKAMMVGELLRRLGSYRRQRVLDSFGGKPNPFDRAFPYGADLAVWEGLGSGKEKIKLHVECGDPNHTRVVFWNNSNDGDTDLPGNLLKEVGMFKEFDYDQQRDTYFREFQFPKGEAKLDQFLEHLREKLSGLRTSSDEGCMSAAQPPGGQ